MTIPIKLGFESCRPILPHELTFSISSQQLTVDTTFTNRFADASRSSVYIVVRQQPANTSLGGLFTLTTTLTGNYGAAFQPISSIMIKVNSLSFSTVPQQQVPVISEVRDAVLSWMKRELI